MASEIKHPEDKVLYFIRGDHLSKSKFGKLDYILYKSSKNTDMNLEKCKVDINLSGLSDHPAIQAVFNLED